MVTKAEWDEIDKKLTAWAEWRTKKAGLDLKRPTCNDCRQPIQPWELRITLGDNIYHDRCGPSPSRDGESAP